jgi:hypothetical protein
MTSRFEYRRLLTAVVGTCLAVGWSLAYAMVTALPPQLVELPWMQLAIGVLISSWGGATATLQRYLAAQYEARPFHWRGEAAKDVMVSGTVGIGTYLAGWVQSLSVATLGLCLLLAGFLGVRLLTVVSERFLKQIDKP